MYCRVLKDADLRGSMGSAGNPYCDARAESLAKMLKIEVAYIVSSETFAGVPLGRRLHKKFKSQLALLAA